LGRRLWLCVTRLLGNTSTTTSLQLLGIHILSQLNIINLKIKSRL
jgi:hypothetical protein